MKKPLPAGPSPRAEEPGVALRDRPRAGAIAHPQATGDLPVAAARQGDEPLGVLGQERLARSAARPSCPAMFACETSRHRLRQPIASGPAGRGAGRAARSPIPRRSSLTGSRWPGRRGSLGPRPSREALERRRRVTPMPGVRFARLRRAAAAAGAARSRPVRVRDGRVQQLDLDADDRMQPRGLGRRRRTGPRRTGPAWSVTASPVSPSSTARSTRSSGGEAPSRNEKLVWQWSSAYGVGATGRSGRPGWRGPASIEHPFCLDMPGRHPDQRRDGQRVREALSCPGATEPHPPGRHDLARALLALVTTPLVGLAGHAQGANAATAIRPRITGIKPLTKEVYGYLPYWRLDSGTADRLHYDYVSTIAFFGLGIQADGNHRHLVGRLQGIRRRRRRGRHQRGPRQGRPGRADVPAVRRRRAPQDDRVPRQRRRPGPVHRPGARPDGRPQGGRREPRLRADVAPR